MVDARIWRKDGTEWEKVDLQTAAITKEQDEEFQKAHPEMWLNPDEEQTGGFEPPTPGQEFSHPNNATNSIRPIPTPYWLIEQFLPNGNPTARYLKLPEGPLRSHWTTSAAEAYRLSDAETARKLAWLIHILQDGIGLTPLATEHMDIS
jgi:hypothetical protein